MHRPVLTFCSVALAIISLCFLPGCASKSSASAKKDLPQPNITAPAPGADQALLTPTNEGRSMPLKKAIDQLVPSDYTVRWIDIEPSQRSTTVTWNANQEWPKAVAQAAASEPGLTIDVVASSKVVLIRQEALQPHAPQAAASTAPAAAASAVPPALVAVAHKRKGMAKVAALPMPQAKVDGVVRLQPVGIRADITPEPSRVKVAERTLLLTARWDMSNRDKTLKATIERWALDAGWRAFWELDVDYPIAATASIDGSFEDAVSAVVHSMDHAEVPLKAIFYRGNQVLRMVPRGME